MKAVFVVEHSYELNGIDETKFIGVYSSKKEAENAISKLKLQAGFKDRPNDFHLNKVEINKTAWTEGYVTIEDIETKDINGNWKTVAAEKLANGNYLLIEKYENHLLGEFKNNDIVQCELRDGILYAVKKIVE